MKIDLEWLKIKKELFVREAEKLLDIQNKAGEINHDYLVKSIVNEPELMKGNLPFCFVQKCIKNTDDIYDLLIQDEKHHRCDIVFNSDVITMWNKLSKRYKKIKPERGDIIIGHYNKQGGIITNGFVGIVVGVDSALNIDIIEATVINNYEEESKALQFNGIKRRVRPLAGKKKCRILGVFTPWFF
jgi:hypothetical protein